MIAFIYIIPAIACLILRFGLGYEGTWQVFLSVFLAGEAFLILCHYLFIKYYTRCREYLGSIVTSVNHEDAWTEIVVRHEVRRDAKGRSYTVTRTDFRRHPEKFYFTTSLGSTFDTYEEFYNYVASLWGTPCHHDSWYHSNIVGGARFGQHYSFSDIDAVSANDPQFWFPITEQGHYVNKVRRSSSIFRYQKISMARAQELGLHHYPKISAHDAPCILAGDFTVPYEAEMLFRKFNAGIASAEEMRLFILLFDASKGIGISELQRAFWQGGNKNEFVICIGLTPDYRIDWARTFSWADVQQKEVEASAWLMDHPDASWQEIFDFLADHIKGWQRKQFSDFNYLSVTLPWWQDAALVCLAGLESWLAIFLVLRFWP